MADSPAFGRTIEHSEDVHRDAVHVAVIPAVAENTLFPAEPVNVFSVGGVHYATNAKFSDGVPVTAWTGIVDPFLKSAVKRDERFWLFLYPNTIQGMRHHWSHPAFSDKGE